MQDYDIITFDKLFFEGKKLNIFINQPYEWYEQIILDIETEASKENPAFDVIQEKCFEIVRSLLLPVYFLPHKFILRARHNENDEIFTRIAQISYNSECPEKQKSGRFNNAGEAIFYACLPTADSSEKESGQLGTLIESYKEVLDPTNESQINYYTTGRWQLRQPFKVFVLLAIDTANENSNIAKDINSVFEEFMCEACSPADKLKYDFVIKYFSKKAGTKSETSTDYIITTAFFHAVRQYYGQDTSILYSSSATDNSVINLALTPYVVENYLYVDHTIMFKLIRNPNKHNDFFISHLGDGVKINPDNTFTLTHTK